MPISADPKKTVEVWLKSDADTPLAERPVVLSRFLTRRQVATHREMLDRAIELKQGDDAWKCIYEAWRLGIVGWRNMPLPDGSPAPAFEAGEKLPDLLHSIFTDDEIQEIAWGYPSRVRLAEGDLKNSVSPAESAQAPSAKDADENAPTAPATESPKKKTGE